MQLFLDDQLKELIQYIFILKENGCVMENIKDMTKKTGNQRSPCMWNEAVFATDWALRTRFVTHRRRNMWEPGSQGGGPSLPL